MVLKCPDVAVINIAVCRGRWQQMSLCLLPRSLPCAFPLTPPILIFFRWCWETNCSVVCPLNNVSVTHRSDFRALWLPDPTLWSRLKYTDWMDCHLFCTNVHNDFMMLWELSSSAMINQILYLSCEISPCFKVDICGLWLLVPSSKHHCVRTPSFTEPLAWKWFVLFLLKRWSNATK